MTNNTTLVIFHRFPKTDEKSDHIEDHFGYWRTLQVDAITADQIILLGAMGSTTNQKSKAGNYFFEIDPIWLWEEGEDGLDEFIDTHKAYLIFKPSDKAYHLKQLIQHPQSKVMDARNRLEKLIELQRIHPDYKKLFPNNIHPNHINPAMILAIKKDIIQFFRNMEDLQLENKRGPRRAMWTNEKGYFYMGICPVDYEYPNTEF